MSFYTIGKPIYIYFFYKTLAHLPSQYTSWKENGIISPTIRHNLTAVNNISNQVSPSSRKRVISAEERPEALKIPRIEIDVEKEQSLQIISQPASRQIPL